MVGEENNIKVKDEIDDAPGLVKMATKEIGIAFTATAETVNRALEPISGLVWNYQAIMDFVFTKVTKKLQNVPNENIETPNPVVVGPALESLKYTGHEENLREMYANLLANALDKNTKGDAHPSFVEIIKQLSPLEARLLVHLSHLADYPAVCSKYTRETVNGDSNMWPDSGFTSNQVKTKFEELCLEFDINLDFASALDNYRRLQILDISIHTNQQLNESFMSRMYNDAYTSEKLELEINQTETLFFTSFGQKFIQICIKDKV